MIAFLCFPAMIPAAPPPIYLWFEPEWFEGVEGSFSYWTGEAKPTGSWGIAGPGISAEWTQGGESEWNSMGAAAAEKKASCQRDFIVPRAGKYQVWVRYVDHRKKTSPFTVSIDQAGKNVMKGELGTKPVVPPNDEYQLYWGFSFGWGRLEANLTAGPARLTLAIDKAGDAWRQVDAVLLTDDPSCTPVGREKPAFTYLSAHKLQPPDGSAWRGTGKEIQPGGSWQRSRLAGRDFTMWTGIDLDQKWWGSQDPRKLTLHDVFFRFSPPADIREKFHKEFADQKNIPILDWPGLVPGVYLGNSPDLSPGSFLRTWLEETRTPFYILTNYASASHSDKSGPATYEALAGPLEKQFLGYIHGEAVGAGGVAMPDKPLGTTRREHVDAVAKLLLRQQSESWSKMYKTQVPQSHMAKSISCLSSDSIALAHLFHEMGANTVGYEEDATNVHVPMRIAFERGAARQYGGAWINYASGNFGDACNYFSQNPVVPRGAPGWFHSKYAITDGVSAGWYRRMYYLNYLSGASAIYWEQSLANQWILPGPGKHPIQLSPFGRGTEDFQAFVDRLPDRGEPMTPIGILLSYGHGYERVNYRCKMLNVFRENRSDLELRELFNVCWHPSAILEGEPAAPDVQSLPAGIHGNIFDVLVDRPSRSRAIFDYPVLWAAGDVDLGPAWHKPLEEYMRKGGTLVVNVSAADRLPPAWLGVKLSGKKAVFEEWTPEGETAQPATPFEVSLAELAGARALAWAGPKVPLLTRHAVGEGALILSLVPNLLGQDERAHPALPFLLNGLTAGLLPIEVRLAKGERPAGEIMYQLNKTKDGFLVMLMNNRGVDKTQSGVARVDRRAFVDVELRATVPVKSAREYTQPRDLEIAKDKDAAVVKLRVHPGDVQVVHLTTR
jgi:hypothetical protein